MSNARLRPDYPIPLVRDTRSLLIPNKKGVSIYRAGAKLPKSKLSPSYKSKIFTPRLQEYKDKDENLKIYQLFHDAVSLSNCYDSQYITRLCLEPSFKTDDKTIEVLRDVKYKTNQISESRAFLHVCLSPITHKYIGFTSHRHNRKFFRLDRAIPVQDIDYDMVDRAFSGYDNVKFIGFRVHPSGDFIPKTKIGNSVGVEAFLYGFFRDCYHFSRKDYDNLLCSMKGKLFPYCNSFITTRLDIEYYSSFIMDFLDWGDSNYGLDKLKIDVKKGHRSYGLNRAWGYICEQLIWYYIAFKYDRNFVTAFINEDYQITYHERIGYGIKG